LAAIYDGRGQAAKEFARIKAENIRHAEGLLAGLRERIHHADARAVEIACIAGFRVPTPVEIKLHSGTNLGGDKELHQ
jgi:hypothetical protein